MPHENPLEEKKDGPDQGAQTTSECEDASPAASAGRKRYDIDIFRDWCKSCGICAAFCPRDCIELDQDGSPFVKDGDRCTGCGWCELHCPDFAISVRARKAGKPSEQED